MLFLPQVCVEWVGPYALTKYPLNRANPWVLDLCKPRFILHYRAPPKVKIHRMAPWERPPPGLFARLLIFPPLVEIAEGNYISSGQATTESAAAWSCQMAHSPHRALSGALAGSAGGMVSRCKSSMGQEKLGQHYFVCRGGSCVCGGVGLGGQVEIIWFIKVSVGEGQLLFPTMNSPIFLSAAVATPLASLHSSYRANFEFLAKYLIHTLGSGDFSVSAKKLN